MSLPLPPSMFSIELRISLPSFVFCLPVLVKSILLLAEPKTAVSLPLPPINRSLPEPPLRMSLPSPPSRESDPALPLRVSFPSWPYKILFNLLPVTSSFPPPALILTDLTLDKFIESSSLSNW